MTFLFIQQIIFKYRIYFVAFHHFLLVTATISNLNARKMFPNICTIFNMYMFLFRLVVCSFFHLIFIRIHDTFYVGMTITEFRTEVELEKMRKQCSKWITERFPKISMGNIITSCQVQQPTTTPSTDEKICEP